MLLLPFSIQANCFVEAGQKFNIAPILLTSIAIHESGMNSDLIHYNSNGSRDLGLMGLNTIHLKKNGYLTKLNITEDQLLSNSCLNIMAGAYPLAKKIEKYGNVWRAVGAYHSENIALGDIYIRNIQDKMARITAILNKNKQVY